MPRVGGRTVRRKGDRTARVVGSPILVPRDGADSQLAAGCLAITSTGGAKRGFSYSDYWSLKFVVSRKDRTSDFHATGCSNTSACQNVGATSIGVIMPSSSEVCSPDSPLPR